MIEIVIDGLDETTKALRDLAIRSYPQEADIFLREEANKLRKMVRAETKAKTKKKTGNLLEGISRSRRPYSVEDERRMRVYNNAPHAHLIEYGHETPKGKKTRDYRILNRAGDEFKSIFENDVEDFVKKLLED